MSVRETAWWRASNGEELMDVTLGSLLDAQTERFADRTAAVFVDTQSGLETRWDYGELKVVTERLACGLIGWGVNHGDHVAVMSPNRAEWILLEYALARIGAVLVTVNPALHERELDYLLIQGRVSHLIFASSYRQQNIAGMVASMMSGADILRQGGLSSATYPDLRGLCALDAPGKEHALPFNDLNLLADGISPEVLHRRQVEVKPSDVMQIQYTSGTTGKPKGAMLSHHSTINNARMMSQRGAFLSEDVLVSAMPLFHTAGCVCNIMGMLVSGGCVVVLDDFDPSMMLAQWERHAATIINGVPTMYSRMLSHADFTLRRTDALRLAFMGGTSIPPSLMKQVCEATGAQPMIIMGMTECSPIITQTNPEDSFDLRIATAGTPLPHTEIRIVDPDTGLTVGWGEKGELCIRGYLLTLGYFNMPEKTAEAIDSEGWLHSGDLAVLEKTGHLRIVGRLKDMIIRAGENVFPVEIEEFLLEHPSVSQAQVVGVPDPGLGEEIFAFVLPERDAEVSADELRNFCRANIARHKMPKYIHSLPAFPMTPNGKIQKFALRQMALDLMQEETSL